MDQPYQRTGSKRQAHCMPSADGLSDQRFFVCREVGSPGIPCSDIGSRRGSWWGQTCCDAFFALPLGWILAAVRANFPANFAVTGDVT